MTESKSFDIVVPYKIIRCTIFAVMFPFLLMIKSQLIFTILVSSILYLFTGSRPYWIYIIYNTIGRDIRLLIALIQFKLNLNYFLKTNLTIVKSYYKHVKKHPEKISLHTESHSWTFREIFELGVQSSHFFKNFGIKRGEAVGLLLGNGGGAEAPVLWLGLSSIGAISSMIPPQLKGNTLIHAIKVSNLKILVFSQHFVDVIREIKDDPVIKNIQLYQWNVNNDESPLLENAKDFNSEIKNMPKTMLKDEIEKGKATDTVVYIFTSGTTGLPKAAIIKHSKFIMAAHGIQKSLNFNEDDIIYTPLPLHHTAGGVVGVGITLMLGNTVVLRGKFSVSNYWKDCIKYNCTVAQYIGEMCRFLLNAVDKAGGKDICGPHKVRKMVGNGLKDNIWKRFQTTFKIDKIVELYGATEGNAYISNIDGICGSIGYMPTYLKRVFPICLIKCDSITGEPIRNNDGFCTSRGPGEPGLFLAEITNDHYQRFEGYVDEDATNKKIIKNVFSAGDIYFNSGDILVYDHFGNFYFVDRTGDTFRWRGENVSTTEVENIMSNIIGLNDIVVYGVQIPHIEGKAGMAAIVDPEEKVDLKILKGKLNKDLPIFAHPIFIRITSRLDFTSTFKIIKKDFQKDGFDINRVKDKIYFLDPISSNYTLLTPTLYNNIIEGSTKL